jgi:hypothetical protein
MRSPTPARKRRRACDFGTPTSAARMATMTSGDAVFARANQRCATCDVAGGIYRYYNMRAPSTAGEQALPPVCRTWEVSVAKRSLVVNGYNVIKVLLELGVSFDEIAALGCHIEQEPGRKLTPELIAVWFEEEKREREVGLAGSSKKT